MTTETQTAPRTEAGQAFLTEGRAALAAAAEAVEALKALPTGANPSELAAALDGIDRAMNAARGRIHLFSQVHPDAGVRDAAEALEREASSFYTALSLDREVYDRVAAVDLAAVEDPLERRLFEHTLRDYRRAGVDRDEATRERVKALRKELVEIGQTFDRNIITGGREFVIEEGAAGLAGLPEDFVRAHPEDEHGHVRLTTDAPDRVPFMTFAEDGDLRRAYHFLSQNRAVPENLAVLQQLLEKRHQLATLLGYANWADYVTEDKMVGSGTAAREFIERVVALSADRARTENDELLDEKRMADPDADVVYEHERGFLAERIRRRRFDFDSQAVRPYFAYDKVRDGIMGVAARLYAVEFRRDTAAETWHPDVETFEMLRGGEVVARLHLDMHPRDDKFKHAAMFDYRKGWGDQVPEATLVCNFPQPKPGDPGLMLFDQVTTFFHEFGHLLHFLFAGRQKLLSFAGIATEWDFVEVPSQLFEEWAWDHALLAEFAHHHETGEPIPADLVARLRDAEEYGKGLRVRGQMFYALLALDFYSSDPAGLDTTERMVELKRRLLPSPHVEGTHFQCSFGHLHGYSAMYYTYMWSLVIAKDFFSRFEGGLMDAEVAESYRACVLAQGGVRDAADLCRDFLGRDYGFDAFEAWLNR